MKLIMTREEITAFVEDTFHVEEEGWNPVLEWLGLPGRIFMEQSLSDGGCIFCLTDGGRFTKAEILANVMERLQDSIENLQPAPDCKTGRG